MSKTTLSFAYWINAQPDPKLTEEWVACYYVATLTGDTQIDANTALARGFLLDPKTPLLSEWKSSHVKQRNLQRKKYRCLEKGCETRCLKGPTDVEWHRRTFHSRTAFSGSR